MDAVDTAGIEAALDRGIKASCIAIFAQRYSERSTRLVVAQATTVNYTGIERPRITSLPPALISCSDALYRDAISPAPGVACAIWLDPTLL